MIESKHSIDAGAPEVANGQQTDANVDPTARTVIGVAPANPAAEGVPERLGKYEIRRKLGAGGMGAVYLAYDPGIDREVAIKVLPESVSRNATALMRFLGEARGTGRLSHPNVIAVFDIGEEHGVHYIVMELAGGGSVADRLAAERRLPLAEACRVVIEAARGLGAAHKVGLIHRDIKPENLMLAADGTVKIVDFGLAKSLVAQPDAQPALTAAGQVLGTPHYMSPEQFTGGKLDERSDVYSLGATFYRLVTGALPFGAKAIHEIMYAHLESRPPDPRRLDAELPPACATIIETAMAKSPENRYASMDALIAAVEQLLIQDDAAGRPAPGTRAAGGAAAAPSVLIVEPSKLQARILADAITRAGAAAVEVVGSAVEALEFVDRTAPDAVIASGHLPDMLGDELFQRLHSRAALRQTVFVLVTATSEIDEAGFRQSPGVGHLLSTGGHARVSKQAGVGDVFRALHAVSEFRLPEAGRHWTAPRRVPRLLVAADGGALPPPLGGVIRSAGLVDVSVASLDQLATAEAGACEFDLVIAVVGTADASSRTLSRPVEQGSHPGGGQQIVFATAIDGKDVVILRTVRRGTLSAHCRLVLDEQRLGRLVAII